MPDNSRPGIKVVCLHVVQKEKAKMCNHVNKKYACGCEGRGIENCGIARATGKMCDRSVWGKVTKIYTIWCPVCNALLQSTT